MSTDPDVVLEPTWKWCRTCRNMGRFHCPDHKEWANAREEQPR